VLNTRIQFIGNWHLKRLAGVAAGTVGLLTGIGVVAPPAGAATTTVVEHVCKVLGADSYGNQAILCTDLLANDYGAVRRSPALCSPIIADVAQETVRLRVFTQLGSKFPPICPRA
jgi:hypothetical protein